MDNKNTGHMKNIYYAACGLEDMILWRHWTSRKAPKHLSASGRPMLVLRASVRTSRGRNRTLYGRFLGGRSSHFHPRPSGFCGRCERCRGHPSSIQRMATAAINPCITSSFVDEASVAHHEDVNPCPVTQPTPDMLLAAQVRFEFLNNHSGPLR